MSSSSSSVGINGDKIRMAREQKGLTQLYLATVVGVTTDTISRWENRRYPSIKPDNAKKLAEALEIPLEELLDACGENDPIDSADSTDETDIPKDKPSFFPILFRRKLLFLLLPGMLVLGGGVAGLYLWINQSGLQATRIMPKQTAPNLSFPVLIKIRGPVESHSSLLVRDEMEGDVEAFGAMEGGKPKQFGKNPRWIGRLENGRAAFLYLVTPGKKAKPEETITFSGDLITREGQLIGDKIGGTAQIEISPYHWADTNQDHVISDDEILGAYETYSLPGDPSINFSALEELWLAGKYTWNKRTLTFDPAPETGKE
ncbi:MAG: helix-turn-helix domain-containing protein [Desulfobulbus sp.]